MAGAFVAKHKSGEVRVAVTGTGADGVFRASAFEVALSARFASAAVAELSLDAADMIADIHGSAEYRANLARVMIRRAIEAEGGVAVFD
jgi:carbon-monoxide dehydrogenase medium subunit